MDQKRKERSATPAPIIVTYGEHRFEIPIPVGYRENYEGVPEALMQKSLENAVVSFVLFQTRTLVDKGTPARWDATAPDDLQKAGHATVDAIMANMTTSIAMREGP